MLQRAYSLLDIKSVDDDQRLIDGIATTPTPDRVGDVVEPKGAQFKLPIPLLWQHRSDSPIGHVLSASVTSAGIRIKAQIAKNVTPEIDRAWSLIKAGLVRGLSIGFRAVESEPLNPKDPYFGGQKFTAWEWLELSAVTIPANADASIQTVKSVDARCLAAIGKGMSDSSNPALRAVRAGQSMNLSQQITQKRTDLKTKSDRLSELRQLAEQDGGLDEAQTQERTSLVGEIKSLTTEIDELTTLEAAQMTSAKTVAVKAQTVQDGSQSRGTSMEAAEVARNTKDDRPKGIAFAQFVRCKMAAYFTHRDPVQIAREQYPNDPRIQTLLKGATTPFTSADGANTGGTALVYAQNLVSEFVEWLRPQTIIGKFGQGGVPALRNVPFNVRIPGQGSAGHAMWVGQNIQKPVTKFNFNSVSLGFSKVATIAALSDELARFSNPSADALVRDELGNAIRERLDIDFIDPDKAVDGVVSPASITNGVAALPSAGNDLEDVLADIKSLLSNFTENLIPVSSVVFIMTDTTALGLSLLRTSLGAKAFPEMTPAGGRLEGIPVIVSEYARHGSPSNPMVIAVSAPNVFLADDGGVSVDMSREASLEMATDPVNDSGTVVSLWQNNLVALKAERYIAWLKRRSTAVAYIRNVGWGDGSPA